MKDRLSRLRYAGAGLQGRGATPIFGGSAQTKSAAVRPPSNSLLLFLLFHLGDKTDAVHSCTITEAQIGAH